VSVISADIDDLGLVGDRRFLVVAPDGRFLTQRTHPRMALIETSLAADALTLSSPGSGSVVLNRKSKIENRKSVTVWKDTVDADDCGAEPAEWLTRFLGLPCHLVRVGTSFSRSIAARKLPSTFDSQPSTNHSVSFADAFPLLVISEASLADLNARLAAQRHPALPMDRFRPNLVVTGAAPYAEDTWARIRIGDVVLRGATLCSRCVVTTTDQRTAERGHEPLRTLATYRRDANGDVNFGRNLVHETKRGTLRVGDRLGLQ
jgi:uncharacterized protein YcbX